MKVRLKQGTYNSMSITLNSGKVVVITTDWIDVPDDFYVYKELEVFGQQEQKIEEPKVIEQPIEPIEQPKVGLKITPKKKLR